MTKPAAAFLQLVSVVVMFLAIGYKSYLMFFVGVALLIWGGAAARRRMRDDS